MQADPQSDKSKARHASEAVTGRAAGHSPSHGSSAQHDTNASTGAAVGTQAQQLTSLAAIDRSAEEALQIQVRYEQLSYAALVDLAPMPARSQPGKDKPCVLCI